MVKKSKLLNTVEWCFDTSKTISGVYIINDSYIGSSCDIYNRIIKHVRESINGSHKNVKLRMSIMDKILLGNKISLKILSKNPYDEKIIYDTLISEGKILFNTGTLKSKKRWQTE
jgi:hypothetical protein